MIPIARQKCIQSTHNQPAYTKWKQRIHRKREALFNINKLRNCSQPRPHLPGNRERLLIKIEKFEIEFHLVRNSVFLALLYILRKNLISGLMHSKWHWSPTRKYNPVQSLFNLRPIVVGGRGKNGNN